MSSMKLKMIDFLDYTDQALSIDLSFKFGSPSSHFLFSFLKTSIGTTEIKISF